MYFQNNNLFYNLLISWWSPLEHFELTTAINIISGQNIESKFDGYFIIDGFILTLSVLTILIFKNWLFIIILLAYEFWLERIYKILNIYSNKYVTSIILLYLITLSFNLLGLVPGHITATSSIIVTFSYGFTIIINILMLLLRKQKLNLFSLFLPEGTSVLLSIFVIPIEILSYFARIISLSLRLLVNLIAGHVIMLIIINVIFFAITTINIYINIIASYLYYFFLGLEFAVSFVQSYVITLLSCMYLDEVFNMH